MCSIGDDFSDETEIITGKTSTIDAKICNKCREKQPNVLLHGKYGYCKTCFNNGIVHKFKAFLGKHRFIKKDDHVLTNFSFGHGITSLLHFLRTGIDISTPKKFKFYPIILYVEQNYSLNIEERKRILQEVRKFVKQFDFKIYFVPFVDYIVCSQVKIVTDYQNLVLNECDKDEISKIFNQRVNATTQNEMYKQLHHQLLIKCAKELNCQHIFLCDMAIDVASQILTSVALGRGNHLEMDIGICDTRDSQVNIIRPLRGFDIKELALYNVYNNIEPLTIKLLCNNPYSNIHSLMMNFVQNLQINFPATITTVMKTGDKLSMDKDIWNNQKCKLCLLPIENPQSKLTSIEATNFSHWISTHKSNYELQSTEKHNETFDNFKLDKENYCFACSTISKYLIKD